MQTEARQYSFPPIPILRQGNIRFLPHWSLSAFPLSAQQKKGRQLGPVFDPSTQTDATPPPPDAGSGMPDQSSEAAPVPRNLSLRDLQVCVHASVYTHVELFSRCSAKAVGMLQRCPAATQQRCMLQRCRHAAALRAGMLQRCPVLALHSPIRSVHTSSVLLLSHAHTPPVHIYVYACRPPPALRQKRDRTVLRIRSRQLPRCPLARTAPRNGKLLSRCC